MASSPRLRSRIAAWWKRIRASKRDASLLDHRELGLVPDLPLRNTNMSRRNVHVLTTDGTPRLTFSRRVMNKISGRSVSPQGEGMVIQRMRDRKYVGVYRAFKPLVDRHEVGHIHQFAFWHRRLRKRLGFTLNPYRLLADHEDLLLREMGFGERLFSTQYGKKYGSKKAFETLRSELFATKQSIHRFSAELFFRLVSKCFPSPKALFEAWLHMYRSPSMKKALRSMNTISPNRESVENYLKARDAWEKMVDYLETFAARKNGAK
jgi:hypothetical protein